jgi:uncharacterized protein YndB with AHSA1/START domain
MNGTDYEPRTSVEALRRATGRDWDAWFAMLEEWGAAGREHGEITAWLADEHGIDSWWTQTVTVEYERARGIRALGSGRDGLFTVSVSKTVAAPVERLFAAFADADLRGRWLPDAQLRERRSQVGRTARFDWGDGTTRVNVFFTAKGEGKSNVAVVHERLKDPQAAQEMQAFWRERTAALKALLEG